MPNHLLHFIITFFTCGLWIIPWVLIAVEAEFRPFRCPTCGTAGTKPRVWPLLAGVAVIGLACLFAYASYRNRQVDTESKPNPTVSVRPSATPMLATSAESATPEIRKAVPVLHSEPSATPKSGPKPTAFPLSRVIGQPESIVNKVLGNPDKRHPLGPGSDMPGGTYVSYPDGPTWTALTTIFYHGKLTHIQFCFKANPTSEGEFFAALGLSKTDFTVTDRRSPPLGAIGYSGFISKQPILIVAWQPDRGAGFCECPTAELTTREGFGLDGTPLHDKRP